MANYKIISPGDKFGCYTVIGKSDKEGKQEFYKVECKCGKQSVIGKSRLTTNPAQCRFCRGKQYSLMMQAKQNDIVGKSVNGLKILDIVRGEGKLKYLTECEFCGHVSKKTRDYIFRRKNTRCGFCPPNYQFQIKGDIAIGHLEDGHEFLIDTDDIEKVSRCHWYVNGGGYLFRRDSVTKEPIRMHRYILGLEMNDGTVVDHLNHNKLDNRKCNLSVGTQSDNCRNNIKRCSNTLGYVGVRRVKDTNNFSARIEKEGTEYNILTAKTLEDAAQAYNVAADYLFGVGIGYRNQVLYPTQEFACKIVENIKEIEERKEAI